MTSGEQQGSVLGPYGILDTPNEPAFDTVVRRAAAVIGSPIALISLLDENRQWFKARVGLTVSETPIAISFCTHAVRGAGVFEVEDASRDRRFAANPLVTGAPGIRHYAGVPLHDGEGQRYGTLCVIDTRPRPGLTELERTRLEALALQAMQLMAERKARLARGGEPGR